MLKYFKMGINGHLWSLSMSKRSRHVFYVISLLSMSNTTKVLSQKYIDAGIT